MSNKGCNHTHIWQRAGKAALAAVLALSLCPGSRELFENIAFANPIENADAFDVDSGMPDGSEDQSQESQDNQALPGDSDTASTEEVADTQETPASEDDQSEEEAAGADDGEADSGTEGSDSAEQAEDPESSVNPAASDSGAKDESASGVESDDDPDDESSADEAEDGKSKQESADEDASEDADQADKDTEGAEEDDPTVLEADTDGAHAELSVDPSVELPEGAQLVVTALVNQSMEEEDGEETPEDDEGEATDESEGAGEADESDENAAEVDDEADEDDVDSESDDESGSNDSEDADESVADEDGQDDSDSNADEGLESGSVDVSVASDESEPEDQTDDSDIDDGTDAEGAADEEDPESAEDVEDTDDADDAEAFDVAEGADADVEDFADEAAEGDAEMALTGADVAIAGLANAIEAFLQAETPDEPIAVSVAEAYVAEVVDADGNLVQIPQDQAELKVTISDPERAELFSNAYAVERLAASEGADNTAAMSAPVSSVLNDEFASADDAAVAIQFAGTAAPAAQNIATDKAAGGITASLQGVQSLVALGDVAMSADGAVAKVGGAITRAGLLKAQADDAKPKAALAAGAGGPLKAPVTDSRPKKETIDTTKLGMTLNLFDYEAVDVNSQNTYAGTTSYTGINSNRNKENELHFFASGSANSNNVTQNGINQFTGERQGGGNWSQQYANQGIVMAQLSGSSANDPKDRYPVLNSVNRGDSNNDKSTEYLFNPSDAYDSSDKRTTYGNVTNLFYYENKGTANELMVYDSNEAYAYYDVDQGDNGSFVVYNGTFDRANSNSQNDGMKVGFFPFDLPKDEWWNGTNPPEINATRANPPVNHHLGMTMNVPLTMPYDGKIRHTNGATTTDSDMIFSFSGDDDMWVFVDGKLVLDIGGIHQPVGGTINFHTGIVQLYSGTAIPKTDQGGDYTYTATGINAPTAADTLVRGDKVYLWNVYNNDESNPQFTPSYPGQTPVHQGIFGNRETASWRAGTSHTLQAFYLERGGCDSNLKISTNIHLATPQTAAIQKKWVDTTAEEAAAMPVQVELIRKATDYTTGELVGYSLVDTQTLEGESLDAASWAQQWKNLPTSGYNATGVYADFDEEGNAGYNRYCNYQYFVREVPVPGYVPSYEVVDGEAYETDDLETIGELDKKAVTIQSPTLAGVSDSNSAPITGVTLQRMSKERTEGATETGPEGVISGEAGKTLNNDNLWQVSYDGLPAWSKDGDTYTDYTYKSSAQGTEAIEVPYRLGQDTDATPSAAAVPANGAVKVTNSPIYLDVQKKWLNSKGQDETADSKHDHDSVWVQLQKQTRDNAQADWDHWADEGVPVKLRKSMGGDNAPWTAKFKVSADENVRYRVLEGTKNGDVFTPSSQLIATDDEKTYVHDATDYTRDGAWWLKANDNEPYTATQEGTTWEKRYYWEELPLTDEADSPKNYLRTFDGESEVKQHTGSTEETFEKDVIKVELTIPAMAASIPDGADETYDYNATVSLGDKLAASMTEPEPESGGSPTWDVVASGDVNVEPTLDADAGTITVKVDAATAKANAGKTITLTVPVKGKTATNLSTIDENGAAIVSVSETRYSSAANSGSAQDYANESTGGECVSLGANGTGAHAVISNKPLVTKLTVKKVWEDADSNDHANDTVWVRILKDGQPAATVSPNPVELKKDMGQGKPEWTYAFEDLDLGGTYTVEEGTNKVPQDGSQPVFEPTTTLEYGSGADKKTYVQKSLKYYNADETERLKTEVVEEGGQEVEKQVPIDSIDGAVAPDAGTAVLENGIPGVDVQLLKVDADTEVDDETGLKTPLEGAKFKLYKDVMPEGAQSVAFSKDDDIQDANLVKKTVETDDGTEEISEYETAADGTIDFPTLAPGFYWLVETEAPAGYLVRDAAHPVGIEVDANSNPSVKAIDVETGEVIDATAADYDTDKSRPVLKVVDADGKIVMWDNDDDPATAEVEKTKPTEDGETYALVFPNLRTYLLPSTGGPGVLPFLFAGAFLATLAVGGGLSPRRRANAPLGVDRAPTAKVQATPARGLRRSTAHSQRTRGGGRWR